jgi:hypothetical protein
VVVGDIIGVCIYNSGGTSEIDMITFGPGGYRMLLKVLAVLDVTLEKYLK